MTSSPPRPPLVSVSGFGRFEFSVQDRNSMRTWTWLSAGGLTAAALLALIGGFPVDMPMPMMTYGWVTPTCGLTRGSTAIARGDLALAWQYNPASFLVAAFGLAGLVRLLIGTATGQWLSVSARPRLPTWLVLATLFVALWAHQQTNAQFIITARA